MPDQPQVPSGGGQPGEFSWRVSPNLTVLKAAGAGAFALAAVVVSDDPARAVVASLAAVALALFAARDLLVAVRLAADPAGVTVPRGFLGRQHLAWADIEAVRVDERRRFGAQRQLLEIDAGETLHLFSAHELNAPCTDVAAALERLRVAANGAPGPLGVPGPLD
jgi:hypothetical protein